MDRHDRPDSALSDHEAERVARAFANYRVSEGKQRAWVADNPGNVAIRRELSDAVVRSAMPALAAGGAVLDVGCGSGWALRALAAAGVDQERLTGLDALPERLAPARRALPGAVIVDADARQLPFPDEFFAVVLLLVTASSLGSRMDIDRMLAETRRVTSPAGVVLLYEPRIPKPAQSRNDARAHGRPGASGARPGAPPCADALPAARAPARRSVLVGLSGAGSDWPAGSHRLVICRPHRLQ